MAYKMEDPFYELGFPPSELIDLFGGIPLWQFPWGAPQVVIPDLTNPARVPDIPSWFWQSPLLNVPPPPPGSGFSDPPFGLLDKLPTFQIPGSTLDLFGIPPLGGFQDNPRFPPFWEESPFFPGIGQPPTFSVDVFGRMPDERDQSPGLDLGSIFGGGGPPFGGWEPPPSDFDLPPSGFRPPPGAVTEEPPPSDVTEEPPPGDEDAIYVPPGGPPNYEVTVTDTTQTEQPIFEFPEPPIINPPGDLPGWPWPWPNLPAVPPFGDGPPDFIDEEGNPGWRVVVTLPPEATLPPPPPPPPPPRERPPRVPEEPPRVPFPPMDTPPLPPPPPPPPPPKENAKKKIPWLDLLAALPKGGGGGGFSFPATGFPIVGTSQQLQSLFPLPPILAQVVAPPYIGAFFR